MVGLGNLLRNGHACLSPKLGELIQGLTSDDGSTATRVQDAIAWRAHQQNLGLLERRLVGDLRHTCCLSLSEQGEWRQELFAQSRHSHKVLLVVANKSGSSFFLRSSRTRATGLRALAGPVPHLPATMALGLAFQFSNLDPIATLQVGGSRKFARPL